MGSKNIEDMLRPITESNSEERAKPKQANASSFQPCDDTTGSTCPSSTEYGLPYSDLCRKSQLRFSYSAMRFAREAEYSR